MKIITLIAVVVTFVVLPLFVGIFPTTILFLALGAALGGFVWFAHEASKQEKQATTVPLEEFKFVIAGESLVKILPNLKDAGLDRDDKVTTDPALIKPTYYNPLLILLKEWLGIFWVSILYPLKKVYKYKIDKSRLVNESSLAPDHKIQELVRVEPNIEVNSLRRYIPRPQFIPEVELSDGIPVDIIVMTEYEVINPRIPIFNYKGKFFPLLDAAIEAAVNDFGNTVKYMEIIATPTGKGSDFSRDILNLGNLADRLETTVGIRPTTCYIIQVGLLAQGQAAKDATQAQEIERLKGEGVKVAAEARAAAIEKLAVAHAKTFANAVEALTRLGVNKDVAAAQVASVMSHREVAGPDSKISAYFAGGTPPNAAVNIPTPPPTTT